ncbi:FAD-binding domain-containing protein [Mycena leptocephala]|nr:FAD-binding domain-containing protein [Mycena leptocephala]
MSPLSILCIFLFQVILASQAIAALFPPSNETTQFAAARACNQLKSSLGSPIVQSAGPEYETAATNTWNLENSEFQPTCIVFPRTSSHVQITMKAYMARAGSHSAMKGWNSVQDGVLIMFSHMKNASYSPVTDSITLEPGIHWQEAVAALEPFGVAPVGDVGTGLLLGGGLSWLSPSQGYAADTLKELDVVLVTGKMVTATATNEYSDLFRALKGGGNRFGIYNSSAEALLKATARYIREVKDPKAVLLVALSYIIEAGELVPFYIAVMFYNGPKLPSEIFGDFLSIPAISSQLGPLSYFDMAGILGLERHFNMTTLGITPIPDSQVQAGRAKGGNIINPPRGGFAAIQLGETFKAGIDEHLLSIPPSPGLPLCEAFIVSHVNECDARQKVFQSYGDYELLKQIYAKYDPTRFNVEHTQGPVGL